MNSPSKSHNIKVPKTTGNGKERTCEKTNLHKEREKKSKSDSGGFSGFSRTTSSVKKTTVLTVVRFTDTIIPRSDTRRPQRCSGEVRVFT